MTFFGVFKFRLAARSSGRLRLGLGLAESSGSVHPCLKLSYYVLIGDLKAVEITPPNFTPESSFGRHLIVFHSRLESVASTAQNIHVSCHSLALLEL